MTEPAKDPSGVAEAGEKGADQIVLLLLGAEVGVVYGDPRLFRPPVEQDVRRRIGVCRVFVFPFRTREIRFAVRLGDLGRVQVGPQPRPKDDDNDFALRRPPAEANHGLLWAEVRRHGCGRIRIVPADHVEGHAAAQEGILRQPCLDDLLDDPPLLADIPWRGEEDVKMARRTPLIRRALLDVQRHCL